jgi:hypothetical protein
MSASLPSPARLRCELFRDTDDAIDDDAIVEIDIVDMFVLIDVDDADPDVMGVITLRVECEPPPTPPIIAICAAPTPLFMAI